MNTGRERKRITSTLAVFNLFEKKPAMLFLFVCLFVFFFGHWHGSIETALLVFRSIHLFAFN